MILRLTNGSDTINLVSSTKKIFDWVPKAPDVRGQDVTDSGRIHISGNTATARDMVNAMNRLFKEAEDFDKDKVSNPVYLEFRPDGDTDVYRSLVKKGKANWSETTFGSVDWTIAETEITFSLTRVGYFEGPETQVEGTTYNLTQGSNLINLAFSEIDGDLVTPARLEITNTQAGVVAKRILVGLNRYSQPNNTIGVYSLATNASISVTHTTEQLLDTFTLSASDLNKLKGNHFHIVLNATANTENFDIQYRFESNGTEFYRSDWIEPDSKYVCLTSLERLPPYLTGYTDIHDVTMKLYLKGRDSNISTLTLNGIDLMPTDSWRLYESSVGLATNRVLVDAPYDFVLYTDGYTASGAIGSFISKGNPVMLYPERDVDILVKMDTDLAHDSTHTFEVVIKYRPRRETL